MQNLSSQPLSTGESVPSIAWLTDAQRKRLKDTVIPVEEASQIPSGDSRLLTMLHQRDQQKINTAEQQSTSPVQLVRPDSTQLRQAGPGFVINPIHGLLSNESQGAIKDLSSDAKKLLLDTVQMGVLPSFRGSPPKIYAVVPESAYAKFFNLNSAVREIQNHKPLRKHIENYLASQGYKLEKGDKSPIIDFIPENPSRGFFYSGKMKPDSLIPLHLGGAISAIPEVAKVADEDQNVRDFLGHVDACQYIGPDDNKPRNMLKLYRDFTPEAPDPMEAGRDAYLELKSKVPSSALTWVQQQAVHPQDTTDDLRLNNGDTLLTQISKLTEPDAVDHIGRFTFDNSRSIDGSAGILVPEAGTERGYNKDLKVQARTYIPLELTSSAADDI